MSGSPCPSRPQPASSLRWAAMAVLLILIPACWLVSRTPEPSPGRPFSNGLGMRFVWIPAGSFEMGLKLFFAAESAHTNELPAHQVTFSEGFWLGAFEVTEAEFEAVMGTAPPRGRGPRYAAQGVSWDQAHEFCSRLASREGRAYRLPSEAEWEYACRAGTETPFSTGDTITSDQANFDNDEADETFGGGPVGVDRDGVIEVGTFPPNGFGLFDMHANVSEWVEDVAHSNYEGAPQDGSAWLAGGHSDKRMLRGGCYMSYARNCRSTVRQATDPSSDTYVSGLRVALSPARPAGPSS